MEDQEFHLLGVTSDIGNGVGSRFRASLFFSYEQGLWELEWVSNSDHQQRSGGSYSTVTDLAKFLGLSTSVPRTTAA